MFPHHITHTLNMSHLICEYTVDVVFWKLLRTSFQSERKAVKEMGETIIFGLLSPYAYVAYGIEQLHLYICIIIFE